jgi:hypothetical protein
MLSAITGDATGMQDRYIGLILAETSKGRMQASGALRISGVVAYRITDAQNLVVVAFKLTDNSYRPANTSPALLASLSGASDDVNQDALAATLAPGDTRYASAGFDVTQIIGLFCLQPNGPGDLPCTMLLKD